MICRGLIIICGGCIVVLVCVGNCVIFSVVMLFSDV